MNHLGSFIAKLFTPSCLVECKPYVDMLGLAIQVHMVHKCRGFADSAEHDNVSVADCEFTSDYC